MTGRPAVPTVGRMAQVTTWRPTVQSMRNLALFWSVLAVTAGIISVARVQPADRVQLLVIYATAAAGGIAVAWVWNRSRIMRALDAALTPKLSNWPPTRGQRDAARRSASRDAGRACVIGAALGAIAGVVPVVGPGVAAAGIAGALGTAIVRSEVRGYERSHDRLVLTAGREGRTDATLVFGVVPQARATR